jgi:hypothetical protein
MGSKRAFALLAGWLNELFSSVHPVITSSKPLSGLGIYNDPSAGSPTETLLRLLLPLSNKIYSTSPDEANQTQIRGFHLITQSVGATGGVYKGQGRSRHALMKHTYKEFLVHDQ